MKKKSLILSFCMTAIAVMAVTKPVLADGCYMCSGGSYVKYTGGDDQSKRKAAQACGCTITGTRSSCDAANLKILCTVATEKDQTFKTARR